MEVQAILDKITRVLKEVPGITGVVLGGSRARGINRPDSDIDIGIYYDSEVGFDPSGLNSIVAMLDDAHRTELITPLGAWGEWINGGGWLIVDGFHVDFILRDIRRVVRVIDDCLVGKVTAHYHAGHPHAYINAMYLGEIAICKILFDHNDGIKALKAKTIPYPEAMRKSIIGYFMFEAGFSLTFAEDNAGKDDLYYVVGHLFRVVSCLNQVLFAVNGEYCINEKKAVKVIGNFLKAPLKYKERVEGIFDLLSPKASDVVNACQRLKELVTEVKAISTTEI